MEKQKQSCINVTKCQRFHPKLQCFQSDLSVINKRVLTVLTQIFTLVVEIFVMIYFLLAEDSSEWIRNSITTEDGDFDYNDDRW